MRFLDRQEAGRQLAEALKLFAGRTDVVVLGIPRGGVPVAFEIAEAIGAPLDIFLSRKLGVPGQEELAFGAVAAGGGRYLDQEIVRAAGVTPEQIEAKTEQVRRLLDERARLYREGRPPLTVEDKVVIVVDDGIATGASAMAAVEALRQMHPKDVVVAAPVAPRTTVAALEKVADRVVVLDTPVEFYAVGQFYVKFDQTSDEEVVALLRRSAGVEGQAARDAAGDL